MGTIWFFVPTKSKFTRWDFTHDSDTASHNIPTKLSWSFHRISSTNILHPSHRILPPWVYLGLLFLSQHKPGRAIVLIRVHHASFIKHSLPEGRLHCNPGRRNAGPTAIQVTYIVEFLRKTKSRFNESPNFRHRKFILTALDKHSIPEWLDDCWPRSPHTRLI